MTKSKPRWEIRLTRQAEKTLYRLPKPLLHQVDQALLALATNPYPPDSYLLAGSNNLYRLPVEEWRLTYAVEAEQRVILILEIAPKQQPERYQLEELSEEISPLEEAGDHYQAQEAKITKANMPEAFFKVIETNFIDYEQRRLEFVSFVKGTHRGKIHLLIVDDIPETRENLRKLLYFEPDIKVVGVATNGEEAIQMALKLQPDIVLMNIILPGLDGIAATETISQQLPSTQIIAMSVHGEADYLRRAMLAGAKEFLIKPFSSDELMISIRRVYQAAIPQRRHAPSEAAPNRDAFKDLKAHLQERLMAEMDPTVDISRPNELGRTILQNRFEQILAQENIVLSRSERTRLFESIVAEILETDLDESQKSASRQWFKFFKLGNKIELSLSVADLAESLSFYQKLGLEKVDGGEKPYPWAVISDGRLYLGLHQRVFSSPTLSYFALHVLSERMDHLPKLGIRLDNIQKLGPIQGMLNNELLYRLKFMTAEFESPEGQRVLLAGPSSDVETTPSGRNFYAKYEAFVELSLNTKDVNTALAYWKQLGFECITEGNRPYPWAIVSDGLIRLGLHQSPKLTKPTITYFAPDMPDRLKRLRRWGVKFVAERKDKKGRRIGAVVESPDGQPFFLFMGEIKTPKDQEIRAAETNGSFKVGQKVRIIEGPFADFIGTVDEVDSDRARVKVQVAFFGQEKSMEFDFLQVEII